MIKIEGKSIEKLIDVASKGMGVLYKPRAIRKEADAEAYKQEVLAKANAKSLIIEGEAKLELLERAKQRLLNQEMNRQINIEDIVEKSIPYLSEEVSENPVDEDWRTRFFKKAKDVSNEEMQEIWGKILAQEVSNPGNISFRALDIVSNLSKNEAELFQTTCSLVSGNKAIYKLKNSTALEEFGLSYPNLMKLREAGLLHDSDNLIANLPVIEAIEGAPLILAGYLYVIKSKSEPQPEKIILQQLVLTQAGSELCSMLKVQINQDYENKFISELNETYIVTKQELEKK